MLWQVVFQQSSGGCRASADSKAPKGPGGGLLLLGLAGLAGLRAQSSLADGRRRPHPPAGEAIPPGAHCPGVTARGPLLHRCCPRLSQCRRVVVRCVVRAALLHPPPHCLRRLRRLVRWLSRRDVCGRAPPPPAGPAHHMTIVLCTPKSWWPPPQGPAHPGGPRDREEGSTAAAGLRETPRQPFFWSQRRHAERGEQLLELLWAADCSRGANRGGKVCWLREGHGGLANTERVSSHSSSQQIPARDEAARSPPVSSLRTSTQARHDRFLERDEARFVCFRCEIIKLSSMRILAFMILEGTTRRSVSWKDLPSLGSREPSAVRQRAEQRRHRLRMEIEAEMEDGDGDTDGGWRWRQRWRMEMETQMEDGDGGRDGGWRWRQRWNRAPSIRRPSRTSG